MERIYNINNSKVTVKFGSIIESKAEIYVSSDDYRLTMGGGISATIRRAAGEEIIIDARKKVPASLGDIVVTTAGQLPQKFIFHAITIDTKMFQNFRGSTSQKEDIQQYIIHHAVKKVFRIMAAMDIRTVAFPAIGAGVAGIPYAKVAKCMGEAFAEALSMTNKSYEVELYLYDRFGKMTLWDYLPFFESFAIANCYNAYSVSHVDEHFDNDYSDVIIKDAREQGKAAQIFISYSRKDKMEIKGICELLNQMNISYWIDVDGTYSGENFKTVIVEAIGNSDLVLFISSANSNASSNVAKEISLADKLKKTILPIKLDNTPYASMIEYDLVGIDYIDYIDRNPATLDKLYKSILGRLTLAKNVRSLG